MAVRRASRRSIVATCCASEKQASDPGAVHRNDESGGGVEMPGRHLRGEQAPAGHQAEQSDVAVATPRDWARHVAYPARPGIGQEGPFGGEPVARVARIVKIGLEDQRRAVIERHLEDAVVLATRQGLQCEGPREVRLGAEMGGDI